MLGTSPPTKRSRPQSLSFLLILFVILSNGVVASSATAKTKPGGRIVFATGSSIRVSSPNGTHKKVLFRAGNLLPDTLTISPDGRKAAFLQRVESVSHWALYITNLSTGRTTLALSPPVYPFSYDSLSPGVWSNDSSRLVVNRSSRGTWVVKADGSGARQLFSFPAGWYSWNKNDSKVAFHGQNPNGSYYVGYYDLGRDRVVRLAKGTRPRWSPTKNLIAINGGGERVKVIDPKGKQVLRSPKLGYALFTEWSSDGKGLFVGHEFSNGDPSQLVFLPLDGSDPTILRTFDDWNVTNFLSPLVLNSRNGRRIAFETWSCTKAPCGKKQKQTIFTAGTQGEELTEQAHSQRGKYLLLLSWSRDSKALLICKGGALRYLVAGKFFRVKGVTHCDAGWAR